MKRKVILIVSDSTLIQGKKTVKKVAKAYGKLLRDAGRL